MGIIEISFVRIFGIIVRKWYFYVRNLIKSSAMRIGSKVGRNMGESINISIISTIINNTDISVHILLKSSISMSIWSEVSTSIISIRR